LEGRSVVDEAEAPVHGNRGGHADPVTKVDREDDLGRIERRDLDALRDSSYL
jgi:hypothetical protein